MQENNLFEEKIIEVGENTNYYVIKQLMYNNNMYLLANELIDDETPSETMAILKANNDFDELTISLETNENIINVLLQKFSNLL